MGRRGEIQASDSSGKQVQKGLCPGIAAYLCLGMPYLRV